jgi:DNA-binding NtrC family response regulator
MNPTRRILLVDDETSILFAFSQYLKAPGVEIDTAETGDQANALIEKNEYCAAVVDLRLTGAIALEGLKVIQALKKRYPRCTVVVVTAYGGVEIRNDVERVGADFYYEKPTSPKVVRDALLQRGVYGA